MAKCANWRSLFLFCAFLKHGPIFSSGPSAVHLDLVLRLLYFSSYLSLFFTTLNRYFYFFSRWRRRTQNVVMDSIWWVKNHVREWVELFFSFVCILVSSLFHPFFCSSSLDFLLLFMVAKAMLLQIIPSRVNY